MLFRTAREFRNERKRVREKEGGRMDIFRNGGLVAGRGMRAQAATTKIRAARHFLREVEPWNY